VSSPSMDALVFSSIALIVHGGPVSAVPVGHLVLRFMLPSLG
jgi:hypothetical protein